MLNFQIIYAWILLGVIIGIVGLFAVVYDQDDVINLEKTTYGLSEDVIRDILQNPINNYFVEEVPSENIPEPKLVKNNNHQV